jgi:hypothetical protein
MQSRPCGGRRPSCITFFHAQTNCYDDGHNQPREKNFKRYENLHKNEKTFGDWIASKKILLNKISKKKKKKEK